MRIIALLALGLVPATGLAQKPAEPSKTPEHVRREIMAVEERIGQANFECDYKFFADVEAPEFIFTSAAGSLITRAEDLAGEKDCRHSKGTYRLDDVRIMTLGNVVVFNALATTTTTKESGERLARTQRFTDVLIKRDGRWQLVAGHTSRVPEPVGRVH
jgi:ketosteroid isomerase-like protein